MHKSLLLSLALAACSAPGGDAAMPPLRLDPDVRIGSETEGPEYQFTAINFVAARGDDVFVAQRGGNEVRVFGADGRHRRTIGRVGSGPGEFQAIWSLGVLGDTLWTIDIDLRRLTLFGPDGATLATVPFEAVPPTLGESGRLFLPYADVLLPDRGFLGFGRGIASSVDVGDVTAYPLLRLDPNGNTVDTLAWVSIKNDDLILRSEKSRSYMPQPFTDSPLTVYSAPIGRAYVIERWCATEPDAGTIRVTAINAAGDTVWTRDIPYTPAPLEPGLADNARADLLSHYGKRYLESEIRRALYVPAFRTPVSAAVASTNGALWIRWDEHTRPASYTLLTPTGELAGEAAAAPAVRLRWVSDSVAWGEELDANDVPTLVRYRITRSKPSR